jgi:hypothetical protein
MGATFLELLITVLQASIKKHGSKPLTTRHLLNICKMCLRIIQKRQERDDKLLEEAYWDTVSHDIGDKD